jgi:ferritin-like metal-binding protein YciE
LELRHGSARYSKRRASKGGKTAVELTSFRDLYLAELQELASSTGLLTKPLAMVAEVASDPRLKRALNEHIEQTLIQRQRIEAILQNRGVGPIAHTDQATQALITELAKMTAILRSDELRDIGLIGSLQRIGHYRIAAYASSAALAARLDLPDDQNVLRGGMEAEKRFDASLRRISESQFAEQSG